MTDNRANTIVDLATNLTVAWLTNPNVRANTDDATGFLQNIHSTLAKLSDGNGNEGPIAASGQADDQTSYEPAVTVRKSLGSREHIISLIDGKPYTTLKRHLSRHGLTPQQYRERYGLKADYPMVAPAYAERRRELARKSGLAGSRGNRHRQKPRAAVGASQRRLLPNREQSLCALNCRDDRRMRMAVCSHPSGRNGVAEATPSAV